MAWAIFLGGPPTLEAHLRGYVPDEDALVERPVDNVAEHLLMVAHGPLAPQVVEFPVQSRVAVYVLVPPSGDMGKHCLMDALHARRLIDVPVPHD
jgi:hypothetical protein